MPPTTSIDGNSGLLSEQWSGLPVGYTWEFCQANEATHYFHIETVDFSLGSRVGCPWAARGNFIKQMRLSTTSIPGNSGLLSGHWSEPPMDCMWGFCQANDVALYFHI